MNNKKTQLKVHFNDFWPEFSTENFILKILNKYYDVIIDEVNPDVLFISIFGDDNLKYKNVKKILYTGEAHNSYPYHDLVKERIKRNFSNSYATMSYLPTEKNNFYIPYWQICLLLNEHYLFELTNKIKHNNFERFCSFIVSNAISANRNLTFMHLSNYKYVNSYGKYMNNSKELQLITGKHFEHAKLEFFRNVPHKFNLCYENHYSKGYITEKLLDSFLMGSLPIYYGPIKSNEWFNKKSYINMLEYNNDLSIIKDIDNNINKFNDMYNEPVFADDQLNRVKNNLEHFEQWLISKI